MPNKEVKIGDDWYLDENNDGDLVVYNAATNEERMTLSKMEKVIDFLNSTQQNLGGVVANPLTEDIDADKHSVNNQLLQNFMGATEKTISTGAITVDQTLHTVDTEADASTDDLNTINGGTQGDTLYLRAANGSREVVLKHGTGNILCPHNMDYRLENINQVLKLVYDGTNWRIPNLVSHGTGARVSMSTVISTLDSTATLIEFDTEFFDDKGEWDTDGSQGHQYKFEAQEAGRYIVYGMITFANTLPADTMIRLHINKNGGSTKYFIRDQSAIADRQTAAGSAIMNLSPGDTISFSAYQASGGAVDLMGNGNTWASVIRLR